MTEIHYVLSRDIQGTQIAGRWVHAMCEALNQIPAAKDAIRHADPEREGAKVRKDRGAALRDGFACGKPDL